MTYYCEKSLRQLRQPSSGGTKTGPRKEDAGNIRAVHQFKTKSGRKKKTQSEWLRRLELQPLRHFEDLWSNFYARPGAEVCRFCDCNAHFLWGFIMMPPKRNSTGPALLVSGTPSKLW